VNNDQLIEIILTNPTNEAILNLLPSMPLNDAWLVSGCIFQTVWNWKTGRDPKFGIKDYDIFYFDDTDLSWEAEDITIQKALPCFNDINEAIEIRNQARVHLWYEQKFGIPYKPLRRATEGIDHFLARACMLGIRRENDGDFQVYAPKGLDDLQQLVIRPNDLKAFDTNTYHLKAKRWMRIWPELQFIDVT
jgi:uncharacterized protein